MNIKNFLRLLIIGIISLGIIGLLGFGQRVSAATNERMMDDAIFDDSQSMQAGDIQNFLNVFPNSCLKNYTDEFPYDYFNYSGSASSAWIIRRVADLWGVNPKLLLAKLEQESNLVSGSGGCAQWRYISAMGYNCPDHLSQNPRTTTYRGQTVQTCVGQDADMGFSRQVNKGAWLLKFAKERSMDNINWQGNSDIIYYGKFVNAGLHKRCGNCAAVYDDGVFQGVDIQTGATASFYNYTPYINQGLDEIYEGWFGSTITGKCLPIDNSISRTGVSFRKYNPNIDYGAFTIFTGSGSSCVESHVWNSGMQSWQAHIASNQPSINPDYSTVVYADLTGNGRDNPIAMNFRNTGSGRVEFHVWSYDMRSWIVHAVSNLNSINPDTTTIQFANLTGKDEPVAIGLSGTSTGMVEMHYWNSGLQTWRQHSITNLPVIDTANTTIRYGDLNGDGRDEAIVIGLRNTTTSKVEMHVWNPGENSWQGHYVTNLVSSDTIGGDIQFADLDGNRVDEAVFVKTANTGSGKIEFHGWNPGFYSWRFNIASNQPTP
jgi:hypothetical protein